MVELNAEIVVVVACPLKVTVPSTVVSPVYVQTDEEGLLVIDEDGQVLDTAGNPVPGLYAAGDIVAGTRNLIATAFALGQNAGLSASDSLRKWKWPGD